MSAELETLDQLLGGELSLTIVRRFFQDDEFFMRGLQGMLTSGDVRLATIMMQMFHNGVGDSYSSAAHSWTT